MLLPVCFTRIVEQALLEDVMGSGDITTQATVDPGTMAHADAVARQPIVACGSQLFVETFRQVDPSLQCNMHVHDGAVVNAGQVLWTVSGAAASILTGERVALNFVQRMAGIATQTRAFVNVVKELGATSTVRITDTRKTTPGLRALERYAVRVGGGVNHRDALASAVLIKDNHIVAAGGITKAVKKARAFAPHTCRIELEADTLQQVHEALEAGVDIIMLDNFCDEDIEKAVQMVTRDGNKRAIIEVSGGIHLARIRSLVMLGVDIISVGALTHSVMAADIGLDLRLLS